ncbi:hypothetical protein BMT55_14720 [Listeria newyorkensis]|uniref:Pre-toxin TG domain-containing protein n=1 Tax=Listeria newyorkensis TaxID=1497681 RepID=A0ABX4XJS2_9LIST|nr:MULTISPECIES: hypothetical protein [Listeria]KGL46537.1 hypothetical protein EP56_01370 [Listeriaceae bacterium FSL A5-0209]KGL46825.1 hypothetical protein EP58_00375 [Listeria newyorkensis]PNP88447.1 hypothetical protein BMT55_14720 [Listeria newyorkensis]RQW66799.1 hypothetical protein DUK53_09210 [Listeria sp. SHR_NRA_18]SQC56757.1 Uncharacterised protein [Listeria newyorkensis]
MDVKYKESEWDKSKNALGTLVGLGVWGKGVIDQLKKINTNFEDAQNDIRKDDRDGVISFSFTDMESKYQTLFEKIEVLHDYAGDAGNMVERVIDEPFYKDIDKFVEKMENLSIDDYETKNTIGATTIITTGGYDYGSYGATTTTVPKDKIKLSDIMAGDNFFADNLKAQFAEYSKQNPDQEFTYEQYQSAVSSSHAFEYDSIRDGQQNLELWRDIGAAIVIIGVSIVCPPAGLALGIAYGTLELSSAATGKDWMTGREMDGTERATRGAFALLDIIPGVKGIRAFSTATKAGGLALDAAQAGSKLTLKQTAQQGLSHLDAMGKQALRESAERIRNVPRVISDVASTVKNTAQEGLTTVKNAGNTIKNFWQPRVVAEGFVFTDDVIEAVQPIVSKIGKETEDTVSYYRVQGGGEGTKTSQYRIQLNDDGTIRIPNHDADLNLSAYDKEHAIYFRDTKRPGGEIIEFKVPKELDDLAQETKIDQFKYSENPRNQGGMAPKLVDPTTPGVSYEFPAPWVEWIEENAHSARIIE